MGRQSRRKRQREAGGASEGHDAGRRRAPAKAVAEETFPGAPSRRWGRVLVGVLIGGWLALHVTAPLSYYVGDSNPYDERFAWRMFSTKRTESCRVSAMERIRGDGEKERHRIDLSGTLHVAWKNGLKRRRPEVVAEFFEWRCDRSGVREVLLLRRCRAPSGERMEPERIRHDCESGETEREGVE